MTELLRTRNCTVFYRSDAIAVAVSTTMLASGWAGGQGVQWVDSPIDAFQVSYSDGIFSGFLLWGSAESSDQYVSFTGSHVEYGFGVLCSGSWLMSTDTYERHTYASRQSGPLVPITYVEGDKLLFSLRGYWTKEDEFTISGDPRAPNQHFSGIVTQRPSALNSMYLGVQTTV